MANINVLITGAGAPGIMGTFFSLRNQSNHTFRIIGTDIDSEAVGKFFLDQTYVVPKPSQEFIDRVLEICKQEEVQVILPQVTKELEWFSKNKEIFKANGIAVLVSDFQALSIANNKHSLLSCCTDNGIECTGKYYLAESLDDLRSAAEALGYPSKPFVAKIPNSSGMRGLRIIKGNYDEYDDFINNKPFDGVISLEKLVKILENKPFTELLVSEYFPGEEYSIDILADKGRLDICVPRSRDAIRTGITFGSTTVNDESLIHYCREIVQALRLDHIVGFQFKRDAGGEFKLLECNPRIQGTMVHSTLSNANIILGAVQLALFGKSGLDQKKILWGTKLKRYWGAFVSNDNETEKV